eukprot:TRINITY_DN1624_c0_g1_i2.p1 TRINITY_DN1624_c0_g1~~TRINITY_DN1624_c0_g1_i2.p1  ORF type:complete len:449 (+),score=118.60 TRINITY_DN1624_c0_g1_i2:137-1483(+)
MGAILTRPEFQLFHDYLNHEPRLQKLKNLIFLFVVFKVFGRSLWLLYDVGIFRLLYDLKKDITDTVFKTVKRIPFVRNKIQQEIGKMMKDIEKELEKSPDLAKNLRLPAKGIPKQELLEMIDQHKRVAKVDWEEGKISGAVYYGSGDVTEVANYASNTFSLANPLHPDLFPGVNKMEAEIVSMVLNMYNGGPSTCGTMTSGGTESILMACKAHREWARETKGITSPEIVAPTSVHAAFDKACGYFGIKLIHVPVDPVSSTADIKATRRAITSNTIMLVGSVPSFPHGTMDDIQELAKLARKYEIGLHVDCCLGGFLVPFMEKAGFPLPHFDFRVPGVTSISCDPHKYGFAPKGSSVVLYANTELRHHQYFVATDWTGGIYASPSIAGSRPGANIAGCWASMMNMGEEGYVRSTQEIISATRKIDAGLREIRGIHVCGQPLVFCGCYCQ